MLFNQLSERNSWLLHLVLLIYLLPMVLLTSYNSLTVSQGEGLQLFALHLVVASVSALFLYLALSSKREKREEPPSSMVETGIKKDHDETLFFEVEKFKQLLSDQEEKLKESEVKKGQLQIQLKQRDELLALQREELAQQKDLVKRREQKISTLEGRLQELKYELETLLNLDDEKREQEVKPLLKAAFYSLGSERIPKEMKQDAKLTLHRYVEMVQSLAGGGHLSSREYVDQGYLLELRNLADRFEEEESYLLFLFHLENQRLMFANHLVGSFSGWSLEKIKERFFDWFVEEDLLLWEGKVQELKERPFAEAILRVVGEGEALPLYFLFALIQDGAFKGHLLLLGCRFGQNERGESHSLLYRDSLSVG